MTEHFPFIESHGCNYNYEVGYYEALRTLRKVAAIWQDVRLCEHLDREMEFQREHIREVIPQDD